MASAIERKHISRKLGTFSGLMYVSMCVCVSVDVFTGAFANDSNLLHRILCVVFIAYQECDLPSGLFGEALEHAKQEWQPKGGGGGIVLLTQKQSLIENLMHYLRLLSLLRYLYHSSFNIATPRRRSSLG